MSNSVRVEPQQERATWRLANFLDVAAVLFAEIGYEATTMTAIAERSGSGIGTLYHYFPDKQTKAFALFNQYVQKVEAYWKSLIKGGDGVPHRICGDVPGTRHRIPKGTSRISAVTGRADPVFS